MLFHFIAHSCFFILIPAVYSGSVYKSGLTPNFKELYADYIYGEGLDENASSTVSVASTETTSTTSNIPIIIISISGRSPLLISYLSTNAFITEKVLFTVV